MDYAKALAQGRTLLGRLEHTQWELARLTHQVVEAGPRGTLTTWENDLGISLSQASNMHKVWAKFGELYDRKELGGRSFNACVVEARASDERAERLRREAEESGRSIGTVDKDRNEERERGKDFRRRLRDPEAVREAIRRDKRTREALRRVFEEEFGPPAAAPPPPTKPSGRLVQQLARHLVAVRDRLNRTLVQMIKTKLTRDDRATLTQLVDQIENGTDWTRSFLESGNTSFEEMLKELVAEGSPEEDPADPAEPPPARRRRVPPAKATEPEAESPPPVEEATETRRRGDRRSPRERDRRVPRDRRTKTPSG